MGGTCPVSCIPFRFLEVDMGDIQAERECTSIPGSDQQSSLQCFLLATERKEDLSICDNKIEHSVLLSAELNPQRIETAPRFSARRLPMKVSIQFPRFW
jgi:hypothetical protein